MSNWQAQYASKRYGEGGAGATYSSFAIYCALFFTVCGCSLSLYSIWLQWKHYRKPNQQRQVVRILWMVPIYGVSTFISLVSLDAAFYVDTFRDIYEAFVIYAFFNLLLNKLGGERSLINMLHRRPPSKNVFPGTLYSSDIHLGDPYTFLFVKRAILQFVYIKPVLALITMLMKAIGYYDENNLSFTSSYLYLTFFYNISVCLSLWSLMVFFHATGEDLVKFRPLAKCLCVKSIIFFSFWQSVLVAFLVHLGVIDGKHQHTAVAIQDFLICLELVPFAIAHSYAFSYKDYYDAQVHSARMPLRYALRDSMGLKDVLMDSLDTLSGVRFNYRAFEPMDGVPHAGNSRSARIMAGLRYSRTKHKKYWIDPVDPSAYLPQENDLVLEAAVDEDLEPLTFDDPHSDDEIEQLYIESRQWSFGDPNYPVIDFQAPLARQAEYHHYGGTDDLEVARASDSSIYSRFSNDSSDREQEPSLCSREGCIDVVVQRGEDDFVVAEDLSAEDEQDTYDIPGDVSSSRRSSETVNGSKAISVVLEHQTDSSAKPTWLEHDGGYIAEEAERVLTNDVWKQKSGV
ncbi:organic solute transporter Ostalpha-domain-containing protein [Radiomyces spectabilis]|uniref:organic solute transporter Ostalpha-domain-containing protein n=1 Tax=Radiomyces spectabilis TaxID=64574 RepID=UPI00221F2361|nr:organic solute transporter Ostalpha-domain-containing protein [Radiomyces spectabilis]KAI8388828.1 organic solute transporter Ostalpha-domain-containing protein [Radiomyces spectabilis]